MCINFFITEKVDFDRIFSEFNNTIFGFYAKIYNLIGKYEKSP
mgnify:CR=1 FL=1